MRTGWKKGADAGLLVAFLLMLTAPVWASASQWKIEMVDQGGPGRYASLKLDKEGNAHLVFVVHEGDRYPLKYGFRDRRLGKWFLMEVASGAGACSLTLDSRGYPHISWVDYGSASGSRLRYARWDGVKWQRQAIPINADVIAYYNSLALDPQDRPAISFYEYRGARESANVIRMRVVTWTGELWQVKTIDGEPGSGKFNGLAADSQGRYHLAYANVSSGTEGLRYALWNGQAWSTEIVDTAADNRGEAVGYSVAIAVDKEGNPHVSYMNQANPTVKYAVRKDGKWKVQRVDKLGGIGYPDRNSIMIGTGGEPCMSYFDAKKGELSMACLESGKWLVETVDTGVAGFTSSLGADGRSLWVAYSDEAAGGIKVAYREIASRSSSSEVQTVPRTTTALARE